MECKKIARNETNDNAASPAKPGWSDIPEVLCDDIFTRLPVKSLLRFKSVSREWNFCISSPDFIDRHLQRQQLMVTPNILIQNVAKSSFVGYVQASKWHMLIVDQPQRDAEMMNELNFEVPREYYKQRLWKQHFKLIGSCNGLVCFHLIFDGYILWNPATWKQCKIEGHGRSAFLAGFGYCSSSDEYKIVVLEIIHTDNESFVATFAAYLFRSGTNMWQKLDITGLDHEEMHLGLAGRKSVPPNQVGETLYWLGHKSHLSDRTLIAFDLAEECFNVSRIPVPAETNTSLATDKCTNILWGFDLRNGDTCFDFKGRRGQVCIHKGFQPSKLSICIKTSEGEPSIKTVEEVDGSKMANAVSYIETLVDPSHLRRKLGR